MCAAGYRPEWVAEGVGHADGGALILKRYRHLYPSESYAAAPSLDALVTEKMGLSVDKAWTWITPNGRNASAHACCQDGRTWDRTRDLSRVKRALSR